MRSDQDPSLVEWLAGAFLYALATVIVVLVLVLTVWLLWQLSTTDWSR